MWYVASSSCGVAREKGAPKPGFFLTSAVEKTQAQNSSQKLKKKTQAPRGISPKSK